MVEALSQKNDQQRKQRWNQQNWKDLRFCEIGFLGYEKASQIETTRDICFFKKMNLNVIKANVYKLKALNGLI